MVYQVQVVRASASHNHAPVALSSHLITVAMVTATYIVSIPFGTAQLPQQSENRYSQNYIPSISTGQHFGYCSHQLTTSTKEYGKWCAMQQSQLWITDGGECGQHTSLLADQPHIPGYQQSYKQQLLQCSVSGRFSCNLLTDRPYHLVLPGWA